VSETRERGEGRTGDEGGEGGGGGQGELRRQGTIVKIKINK